MADTSLVYVSRSALSDYLQACQPVGRGDYVVEFGGFDLFREIEKFGAGINKVGDDGLKWLNNAANCAGREINTFAKGVDGVIRDTKNLVEKVPVLGKALSAVIDLSLPGVSLASAIVQGKRIDQAIVDDFKNQMANVKNVAGIAKLIVGFIPGIGTGVAAAIAAGCAIAEGKPIEQVLIDAACAAIPGGAIAQAVATFAIEAAQGKSIAEAALGAVGGAIAGKAGQIAGSMLGAGINAAASGQDVGTALLQSGASSAGKALGGSAGEAAGKMLASAGQAAAKGQDVGQALIKSGGEAAGKAIGGKYGEAVGNLASSALQAATTNKDVGQALIKAGTAEAGKAIGGTYGQAAANVAGAAISAATSNADIGQALLQSGTAEGVKLAGKLELVQSLPPVVRENLTIVNRAVRGEDIAPAILDAATKALPKELADAATVGMALGRAKAQQIATINAIVTMSKEKLTSIVTAGEKFVAGTYEFAQAGRLLSGDQRQGFLLGSGVMTMSGVNEDTIIAFRNKLSEEGMRGFDLAISAKIGMITKTGPNSIGQNGRRAIDDVLGMALKTAFDEADKAFGSKPSPLAALLDAQSTIAAAGGKATATKTAAPVMQTVQPVTVNGAVASTLEITTVPGKGFGPNGMYSNPFEAVLRERGDTQSDIIGAGNLGITVDQYRDMMNRADAAAKSRGLTLEQWRKSDPTYQPNPNGVSWRDTRHSVTVNLTSRPEFWYEFLHEPLRTQRIAEVMAQYRDNVYLAAEITAANNLKLTWEEYCAMADAAVAYMKRKGLTPTSDPSHGNNQRYLWRTLIPEYVAPKPTDSGYRWTDRRRLFDGEVCTLLGKRFWYEFWPEPKRSSLLARVELELGGLMLPPLERRVKDAWQLGINAGDVEIWDNILRAENAMALKLGTSKGPKGGLERRWPEDQVKAGKIPAVNDKLDYTWFPASASNVADKARYYYSFMPDSIRSFYENRLEMDLKRIGPAGVKLSEYRTMLDNESAAAANEKISITEFRKKYGGDLKFELSLRYWLNLLNEPARTQRLNSLVEKERIAKKKTDKVRLDLIQSEGFTTAETMQIFDNESDAAAARGITVQALASSLGAVKGGGGGKLSFGKPTISMRDYFASFLTTAAVIAARDVNRLARIRALGFEESDANRILDNEIIVANKVSLSVADLETKIRQSAKPVGEKDYFQSYLPDFQRDLALKDFAFYAAEGMLGAPPLVRLETMRVLATDPTGREGAAAGVEAILTRRANIDKSWWLKVCEWFGIAGWFNFHGEAESSEHPVEFGDFE